MDASKLIQSLLGGMQQGQPGQQAGQQPGGQDAGAQSGQSGLGGLLGSLTSGLTGQNSTNDPNAQGGGLLGNLAAGLTGGNNTQGGNTGGLSGMLSQLNNMGGGLGGLAAGGILGMLAGGRGFGSVAKIGGVAALGLLAHRAYQSWQSQSGGQTAAAAPGNMAGLAQQPDPARQLAAPAADGEAFALTLVRAMISAANADGNIDRDEQKMIFEQVEKLDLDSEGKSFIFEAMQNPATASQIAALSNGPEQAAQIYLMSRLAINPDHPAEQAYLNQLADGLQLPNELVAHLEQQVAAVQAG